MAHGEIFTVATDRGEPQRVSATPWKEQQPRWSADGKWIAFVSDRTGREELFISDELGKNPKQLTTVDCDKSGLLWTADSESLLWSGSDHKLHKVEIESGAEQVLATGEAGNIADVQLSPDGKWLSYTSQDKRLRAHVWIKELSTGLEHIITNDAFQVSTGAKWAPDGKRLFFLGGVSVPGVAQLGWGNAMQVFAAAFQPVEKDPGNRDINTEAQADLKEPAVPGPGRGAHGDASATPPVQVKIDWDGLTRRITQLTRQAGSVTSIVPSPDGRMIVMSSFGDGLLVMNEDGSGITRLNTAAEGGRGGGRGGFGGGAEPQWTKDSRSVYYIAGGGLYNLAVTPPPSDTSAAAAVGAGRAGRGAAAAAAAAAAGTAATGAQPRRVNFTLRMEFDTVAEQRQVFAEAWRVMKNRFYDPQMHGVNWSAARDKYESLLPHVADLEELHNLIMEMIGELNASHTGITGGNRIPGENAIDRVQTRYPGFDLVPDPSGFYKISTIYRNGPADHEYMRLATGNFVLAVNDYEITPGENYWKLFNVLPGGKFEFVVNSKPTHDGAWTVSVEPITSAAFVDLQYAQWVEDKRQMVARLTDGTLGYLHIRAMDEPSLRRFETDLLANQDKKGLIIDERFNSGGGIDQELLELLNQRVAYQRTRGRDSVEIVRPGRTYLGPMVVLQNERSASDAEMFPDGFRRLGLGKIIGMPTYGAVIGTGAFTLLDGSSIRTPGAGIYTATGENMENFGVPPDILVDNTPADFLAGHDRQIEKAIEVLNGGK
ncbi:MAG: peptidase [Bryobacterales bacterium]|nr:peptidase [Bryobacterales bacterium]